MREINSSTFFDAKELAKFLDIDYGTLRNLLNDENASLPPCVRIGKRRYWKVSAVDEWLKKMDNPSRV